MLFHKQGPEGTCIKGKNLYRPGGTNHKENVPAGTNHTKNVPASTFKIYFYASLTKRCLQALL